MRTSRTTKKFQRHYVKLMSSGRRDINKLDEVMFTLTRGQKLHRKHKDHALKGKWMGFCDCHIEGDWVLLYKIDEDEEDYEIITFHAIDNHSNLF